MAPFQEFFCILWHPSVPNGRQIFVGQRRIDEWILPGVMPRHPVADDSGELPDLEMKIFRGTVAEKIFIQPDLGAAVTRIEAAVHARLGKEKDVRSDFEVDEQGQSWVEQKVVLGKNEGRRWLI